MDWLSAIGGLLGGGASAFGAYNQQKAQQGLGGIHYKAPNYQGTMDYLNGNYYTPQFQNYTATPYDTGYQQYMEGGNKYAPQISQFLEEQNNLSNNQYRQNLFQSSPTLQRNIAQQGALTQQFLHGQIPADVQRQIANRSAETSLAGGFGGSQVARNLTARDLGLTSLDLIGRGQSGLQQQLGYAQSLNPYQSNTLDYLMTPQQLEAQDIQQNQYGNQVYNQNQRSLAEVKNQQATAIANLMAQQAQANAGAQNTQSLLNYQSSVANPWGSALASGAGALAAGLNSYGMNNYGNYGLQPSGGWPTQNGGYWNPNA